MPERESSGIPVPKFASFRPKPPVTQDPEQQEKRASRSEDVQSKERHKSGGRHSTSRTEHWRGTSSRHSRIESQHEKEGADRRATPRQHGDRLKEESLSKLYTVDVRGDEDNLLYGSLHKYSVPLYRRIGFGNILGISLRIKIDRDLSTDKKIVLSSDQKSQAKERYRLSRTRNGRGEVRIRPTPSHQNAEADADFLFFGKNLDKNHSDSEDQSEDDATHYRSIQGNAKTSSQPLDQDLEYTTEVENIGPTEDEGSAAVTNSRLTGQVEERPSDGQAWLDLIDCQSGRFGERASEDESRSIAEVRLSMIEKALKTVKDKHHREKLLIRLMDQAEQLWDSTRTKRKWEDVLSRNPSYIALQIRHVDFLQTNIQRFQFDDVRDAFARILRLLGEMSDEQSTVSKAVSEAYVLLRATICMKEAGFSELAFAIWQANLEFNFFQPQIETRNLKENFEEFWESEVPRIGEPGARGWPKYLEKDLAAPQSRQDQPLEPAQPDLKTWYSCEGQAEGKSWPARTTDVTIEDDPYRVVLFADVEHFLIGFEASDRSLLLEAILVYSGLPPLSTTDNLSTTWCWDSYVRSSDLGCLDELDLSSTLPSDKHWSAQYFRRSPDTTFGNPEKWFSVFPSISGDLFSTATHLILTSLADDDKYGELVAEYLLGLELAMNPETARKTAKKLLKKRPSSLRLYNAYASIEVRRGNLEVAANVLATAINMSKANSDIALLWETWIWAELQYNGTDAALYRLLTIVDSEVKPGLPQNSRPLSEDSKTAAIRVYRHLTSTRDHYLSLGKSNIAIHYMTLLILSTYLSSKGQLTAVFSCFDDNISLLPLPLYSSFHELLHQSLAHILHSHANIDRSFSPKDIRSRLEVSVGLFPQNGMFFTLLDHYGTKFRIDDKVQSVLSMALNGKNRNHNPQASETVLTHIYSIRSQLSRSSEYGSNEHSIRSTFERAITSEAGKKNGFIWKALILWEVGLASKVNSQDDRLKKAKAAWWRAVRACPWVKKLWTLPWEIKGLVEDSEKRGIYDLMRDKEIRIRVRLDD